MACFGNDGEVDLIVQSSVLNSQVRIIEQYNHIKNPEDLKNATGANNDYIRYVLENKRDIISKWERFSRYIDDCDGIDALLLGYMSHCKQRKIKPSVPMIMSQVENLLNILKVHPYHIKPYIWTIVRQMSFNKLNIAKPTNKKNVHLSSLLDILVEDGTRLLQKETLKRFLKSIETTEENHCASVMQLPDLDKNSNKSNTTSSDDLPHNTELLKIKEEPLEYTDYESNTNSNLRPELIKHEIIDDYEIVDQEQNEFIDFSCERGTQQQADIPEDNENEFCKTTLSNNVFRCYNRAGIQMKNFSYSNKICNDNQDENSNKNLNDFGKEIKRERSDDSSSRQIQIDENCNKLEAAGNKDNFDCEESDEIVLEIEGCDNEDQVEFLEAIKKYIEECSPTSEEDVKIVESSRKQESIEIDFNEECANGEVMEILEIIYDDDDDIKIKKVSDNDSESLLKSTILKNIVNRNTNEIADVPSSI